MAIFSDGKVNQEEFQERKRKAEEREALVERIKQARMMSVVKEEKQDKSNEETQKPIVFSCTRCGKVFKKNIELKMHMRRDHDDSRPTLALEHQADADQVGTESEVIIAAKSEKTEQMEEKIQKEIQKTAEATSVSSEPAAKEKAATSGEKQPLTVAMIVATSPYFSQYSGLPNIW